MKVIFIKRTWPRWCLGCALLLHPSLAFGAEGVAGSDESGADDASAAPGATRPSEFLQGSPRFLPPELLAGHAPGPAGDVYQVALLLAWLIQEQLRRFTPASLHGSPVGQQWACAQAWHEPARQALKAHRCDGALDPNPRARPSAQELCSLLNS